MSTGRMSEEKWLWFSWSILLTSFVVGVMFFVPLPVVKSVKKQYEIGENGKVTERTVSEEVVSRSVLGATNGRVVGKVPEETISVDAFLKWEVLENEQGGYQFSYPEGFKLNYSDSEAVVLPPEGKGEILVEVGNRPSFEVMVNADGAVGDQKTLLDRAGALVKSTFKFIQNNNYSAAELKQRFKQ